MNGQWQSDFAPPRCCPSLGPGHADGQSEGRELTLPVGSAQWRLWGKRYAAVTFNWSKEAFPFPFPPCKPCSRPGQPLSRVAVSLIGLDLPQLQVEGTAGYDASPH